MSEWSKEPDSKSGVGLVLTVGSNPTHSAFYCFEETRLLTAASFVFFGIALGWFSSFLRFFALTEEIFLPKFGFSNLLKKTLDVSMVLKNDFLDLLHVHRLLKNVPQRHTPPINAIQSPTVPCNAHKSPKQPFISYNCPIYVKNNAKHCQTTGPNSKKTAILRYFDTSWWCL